MDEYDGGALAAERLIELGHRSVFVLAPYDTCPSERRSLGILDTLTAARLSHYPLIRSETWKPKSGYEGPPRCWRWPSR